LKKLVLFKLNELAAILGLRKLRMKAHARQLFRAIVRLPVELYAVFSDKQVYSKRNLKIFDYNSKNQ